MPGDDIVDDKSMIFTEADVYMIAGYLSDTWEVGDDIVADVEEAITTVLGMNNG